MRSWKVVLFVALSAACARTPSADQAQLRVLPLAGDVRVVQGEESTSLDEATDLDAGSRVVTGATGRAEVLLPAGRRIELAPNADVLVGSPDGAEINRGRVLVEVPEAGITLQAGDAEIQAKDSVFRLERGFSVVLGVYRGAATVVGSGVAPVPELRQATVVPGGAIPSGPRPLVVDPNDAWDAKLLGPAIDLGLRLLNLERGLTRQLPSGGAGEAIGGVLSSGVPRTVLRGALTELGGARAVVAATLAGQVARLDGIPLGRALASIVDLVARQGADWVVVVAQWALTDTGFAASLLGELARTTAAIARFVAPPPAAPTATDAEPSGRPVPPSQERSSDAPAPDGDDDDPKKKDGPPREGDPPADEEDPPDEDEEPTCNNQVECVVEDVIDAATGND